MPSIPQPLIERLIPKGCGQIDPQTRNRLFEFTHEQTTNPLSLIGGMHSHIEDGRVVDPIRNEATNAAELLSVPARHHAIALDQRCSQLVCIFVSQIPPTIELKRIVEPSGIEAMPDLSLHRDSSFIMGYSKHTSMVSTSSTPSASWRKNLLLSIGYVAARCAIRGKREVEGKALALPTYAFCSAGAFLWKSASQSASRPRELLCFTTGTNLTSFPLA